MTESFENLNLLMAISIVLHSEPISYFYCSNNFYSLRESVGPIDMPNILFWRVETTLQSRTKRSGAVLVEENEQGHELLEIMTYD